MFLLKNQSTTVEEAEEIIALAKEFNVKGQVGHVERFNPAFIAVKDRTGSIWSFFVYRAFF